MHFNVVVFVNFEYLKTSLLSELLCVIFLKLITITWVRDRRGRADILQGHSSSQRRECVLPGRRIRIIPINFTRSPVTSDTCRFRVFSSAKTVQSPKS